MQTVRLIQSLRIPGGAFYSPGEVLGLPDDEAATAIARGWAVAVPENAPEIAASPVVDQPPTDKMVREARRK